jgi:hypothetical protein
MNTCGMNFISLRGWAICPLDPSYDLYREVR